MILTPEQRLRVGNLIDALTSAAATLELAAKFANELAPLGMTTGTRDWCDDTAINIRVEAEHVKRMFS